MRVQVDVFALWAALSALTPADFVEWDRQLGRLREACGAADYPAAVERDFDFHRFLFIRGGLADLVPLWTTLITKTTDFYKHRELAPADLPAVQKAREAAARAKCQNNLKQPALTAPGYHDANGRLPMLNAWFAWDTWVIELQPYIEQDNVCKQYDLAGVGSGPCRPSTSAPGARRSGTSRPPRGTPCWPPTSARATRPATRTTGAPRRATTWLTSGTR
jgi:hypothetical protein